MKLQAAISTSTLLLCAVLSTSTYACSTSDDDSGMLSTHPKLNKNLGCGEFEFASLNEHYGSSFIDRWKFSVAEDSTASISVFDLELALGASSDNTESTNFDDSEKKDHSKKSLNHFDSKKIFDTSNLTFKLYDDTGNLLGKAYENETLSGLALEAGHWYTLKVSGRVSGLFGSAYYGTLDTCMTPVPLSDTAPLLGSALALLALQRRRSCSITA